MNFYLQKITIDLKNTQIENIFLTDYMPCADGNSVKVYLLGYKFAMEAEDSEKFTNETIAKTLNISLEEVYRAWDYWEKQQIIIKHAEEFSEDYSVEFVNLKQHYIDNIYKHIQAIAKSEQNYITNDEVIMSNRIEEINAMHQEIEKVFGKPITIAEKKKINQWIKTYNISPEMMVQVVSYCVNNKKKTSFAFIEKTVVAWDRAEITDLDKLAEFLEKKEYNYSVYSRVSYNLGFSNRALTEAEMRTIDKWINDYGFSQEIILKALDSSTKISNPNINYFDVILGNWYEKGYKTIEDVEKDEEEWSKKDGNKQLNTYNKPTKTHEKPKNKFHNFQQKTINLTEIELEEAGRKNFAEKLKKLGIKMPAEE